MTLLQPIAEAEWERSRERHLRVSIPEPNIPLLRKTLEWAEEQWEVKKRGHASEWNQMIWVRKSGCGTACCIFGKIAFDNGVVDQQLVVTSAGTHVERIDGPEGYILGGQMIRTYAQGQLGLLSIEAAMLSHGSNNIDDLRKIGNWIAERAGEKL